MLGDSNNHAPTYVTAYKWAKDLEYSNEKVVFRVMGICFYNGFAVRKDENKAMEYLKKGADSGDRVCEFALAHMYLYAGNIERDEKKAFNLFKGAAQKKYKAAYKELARCYKYGIGTNADKIKANEMMENITTGACGK